MHILTYACTKLKARSRPCTRREKYFNHSQLNQLIVTIQFNILTQIISRCCYSCQWQWGRQSRCLEISGTCERFLIIVSCFALAHLCSSRSALSFSIKHEQHAAEPFSSGKAQNTSDLQAWQWKCS